MNLHQLYQYHEAFTHLAESTTNGGYSARAHLNKIEEVIHLLGQEISVEEAHRSLHSLEAFYSVDKNRLESLRSYHTALDEGSRSALELNKVVRA